MGKAKKAKAVKSKVNAKVKTKIKAKPKAKATVKPKAKVKTASKVKKVTPKKAKVVAKKTKSVAKKVAVKKIVKKAKAVKAKTVAVKAPTKFIAPVVKTVKKNIDYSKAITPLGDRLVVRVVQAERVTAGGLILPDTVNTATGYLKGEVLAVGKGEFSKKGNLKVLDVKIGQTILFSEYASTKVNFHDEDLYIVHEKDVLGIVD